MTKISGALKSWLKIILPEFIIEVIVRHRYRKLNQRYDALYGGPDPGAVFGATYKNALWGTRAGQRFYSGSGSHDEKIVTPYIDSLRKFFSSMKSPPSVLDLGCGDFNVGKSIRQYCGKYIACDVVAELIEYNRARFSGLDVDFRQLDITRDPLPSAEVITIRQVLQHLSNEQINSVLRKISESRCRFLIITEGVPKKKFIPNIDKLPGPGVRAAMDSGVVITQPPFEFSFISEEEICSQPEQSTVIVTTVYKLHEAISPQSPL